MAHIYVRLHRVWPTEARHMHMRMHIRTHRYARARDGGSPPNTYVSDVGCNLIAA